MRDSSSLWLMSALVLVPVALRAEEAVTAASDDLDARVAAAVEKALAAERAAQAAAPAAAPAPEPAAADAKPAVKSAVHGQYRPRFELLDKTLGPGAENYTVSHRARIKVTLSLADWTLQVDPQHVLTWGTATELSLTGTPVPSAKALGSGILDFHQAYVDGALGRGVSVRVGRQEIVFDDQRILGNIDWLQQGQSFDAVKLRYQGDGGLDADLFAAILWEGGIQNETVYGLHIGYKKDKLSVALPVVAQYAKRRANGDENFRRATPGLRLLWGTGDFGVDAAGYYQLGRVDIGGATQREYGAWLAAARLSYALGPDAGTIQAGADALSGDDDTADDKIAAFDTLFATNHKWYGWMDYYLNVPVHTANLGLVDVTAQFETKLVPGLTTTLAGHYFMTMAGTPANDRTALGEEVDLMLARAVADGVKLVGGYSLYVAGDAMPDIAVAGVPRAMASGDLGHWAWAQLDVNF